MYKIHQKLIEVSGKVPAVSGKLPAASRSLPGVSLRLLGPGGLLRWGLVRIGTCGRTFQG